MKRASRNYAFVRRVIEMKRTIVNFFVRRELRLHSNANAKLRLRLVVIFALTARFKGGINWYSD